MREASASTAGQVRSLTRALDLLRHLAASSDGLSLTQLSEAARLPPSTTHRLLTTLEAEHFVRCQPGQGAWQIGVSAFNVGTAFSRARDKLVLARPYLRRLMELSGETANLFVESDGEAICIGQVESRHAMRAICGIGGRVAMHASASGKVLLANLEAGRQRKLLAVMTLARATPTTITEPERLEAALEQARAQGYAVDDEEHAVGLRCVAAPLFDEFGEVAAAISISGPAARIPAERIAKLGRLVAQAAGEATRDYGGETPLAAQ